MLFKLWILIFPIYFISVRNMLLPKILDFLEDYYDYSADKLYMPYLG